uniref:Cytochrome P450 84A1 n=1 Tax=Aegilops tauschii TaxID=37682 RepID=M8CLB2_AEGTA
MEAWWPQCGVHLALLLTGLILYRAISSRRYGDQQEDGGELLFNMSMNITLRAALGMRNEGEDAAEFVAIVQEFAELFVVSNSTLADYVPWVARLDLQGINRRMVAARGALDRFIDRAIDEHLAHPKPVDAAGADMVDGMLAFLVDMPVSADRVSTDSSAHGSTLRLTRDNIKATIMVK